MYYYWSEKPQAQGKSFIISLLIAQDAAAKNPAVTRLDINEEEVLNDDRISINQEGIQDDINETGKAVLEGMLFDFDKATLKSESQAAVSVIADYLKLNPKKKFYVVGLTDDKGLVTYNQKLSTERANAVVKELAQYMGFPTIA